MKFLTINISKDTPVKILDLIDTYRKGGPGKTIINTAKLINVNLFEIHVASFKSNDVYNEFSEEVIEKGIPYLSLPDTKGITIHHLILLRNYIYKNNIKILHTHGYKADLLGLVVRMLCKGLILITTHHGWIMNTHNQKLLGKADQLLSRFFDGVITVSDNLKKSLPKNLAKSERCIVIHNALVIDDYQLGGHRNHIRSNYLIKECEFLLGVFGRLSVEKGCLEMLDAFSELQKRINGIKLIYVGEGPLFSELRQRVIQRGLSQQVIFANYQNPIQPYYEAIDLLVSPSRTEGLSNVILEAMALRVPVVATNVGGNSEIIIHGFNGFLVQPGNIPDLTEILFNLIKIYDNNKKNLLIQEAYETIEKRFSFKERIKKLESYYCNFINQDIRD